MSSKALEMGVCLHSGPVFGKHERTFFLGLFIEKILFREICVWTPKDL
jgi:hypothetical protein